MAQEHDLFDDIIEISKGFDFLKNPLGGVTDALDPSAPQWNPADYKERPRGNTIPCLTCKNEKSGCTACMDVCPVNAIEVEEDAIEILDSCRKCGLCAAACPTEAIISPRLAPKNLYDDIVSAATSHETAYVTCTRALKRMPRENEVVVACVGDITAETWFSVLADYPNVSVYLPLGVCDKCRNTGGEDILGEAIATAEEWAGTGMGLEVDPKSLKCHKRREYERKEYMEKIARTTGLTVTKLNPATAALAQWKAEHPKQKLDDLPFFMVGEVWQHGVARDHWYDNGFDSLINFDYQLDALANALCMNTADPVYAKYYDEVVILLETGLRISELCGLTPADLNFEKRFVNVDHQLLRSTEDGYYTEAPKTESGFRQVPMSAAAYEAFERVLKKRRDGRCIEVDGYKDFLFLNRDGLPKTAVNYDAMFKCLAKKYNKCHKEPLPDVMTPHTMRHTFCTRMANAGMNPKALQYIMGHANIVMTLNYYAHATFHSAQEEMERLQAKAKTTAEAKPEPAAESAEETKAA